jgi:MFS family permease
VPERRTPAHGDGAAHTDQRDISGWALYRFALGQPHVGRLVAGGLIGRVREGGIGLAIVLSVQHSTGSFTIAGASAAAFIAAAAVGRPLQGRLSSVAGARRVLVTASWAHTLAIIVLAACVATRQGPLALLVVTAICGLLLPTVSAFLRASWALVLPGDKPTAYAIDAVTYDVSNTIGPALVALLAQLTAPAIALAALSLFGLLGMFVMVSAPVPPRDRQPAPRQSRRTIVAGVVATIAVTAGLVAFAEGSVTVAVPGFGLSHHAVAASGYLLSVFAIGSLVGGIFYGARQWKSRPAPRLAYCLLAYAVGLGLLALTDDLLAMGVVILFAGSARAPAIATMSLLMDGASLPAQAVEAFAWMSLTGAAGSAAGQAVAGALGPPHVGLSFLAAGVAVLGAAALVRWRLWRAVGAARATAFVLDVP